MEGWLIFISIIIIILFLVSLGLFFNIRNKAKKVESDRKAVEILTKEKSSGFLAWLAIESFKV